MRDLRNQRYRQLSKEGYLITVSTIRQYPSIPNFIKDAETKIDTCANEEIIVRNKMRLIVLQTKIDAIESALECFSIPDRMIIENRFFEKTDFSRIDGACISNLSKLCKKFVLTVAKMLGEE